MIHSAWCILEPEIRRGAGTELCTIVCIKNPSVKNFGRMEWMFPGDLTQIKWQENIKGSDSENNY